MGRLSCSHVPANNTSFGREAKSSACVRTEKETWLTRKWRVVSSDQTMVMRAEAWSLGPGLVESGDHLISRSWKWWCRGHPALSALLSAGLWVMTRSMAHQTKYKQKKMLSHFHIFIISYNHWWEDSFAWITQKTPWRQPATWVWQQWFVFWGCFNVRDGWSFLFHQ